MKLSKVGLQLIKDFEGFRAKAYKDIRGVWTIGYGTTDPEVAYEGNEITPQLAGKYLARDIQETEMAVEELITFDMSQPQFDALVSFTYNVGIGALERSTLRKLLNQGKELEAAEEFGKWTRAGTIKNVPGLVRRRAAERTLFLSGISAPIEETNVEPDAPKKPNPVASKGVQATAGVGVAGALTETATQLEPLAPYSETIRLVFVGLVLVGIVWAVWGARKNGA